MRDSGGGFGFGGFIFFLSLSFLLASNIHSY